MPAETPTTAPLLELEGQPGLSGPLGPGRLLLAAGELAFLDGESGSGKTRLLRRIVELEPFCEGRCRIAGTSLAALSTRELRARIGLLPQELPNHPCTPAELLARVRGFAGNRGRCLPPEHLTPWLDLLELTPLLERQIRLLSGGEKRRLALALLLVPDPDLLLLDEPDAGLDPRRVDALADFARRCLGAGKALLWVSHQDLSPRFPEAARYRMTAQAARPAPVESAP